MPSNPSSPILAIAASGIQPSFSHCAAFGASSAREKSRAVSRTMRCSSVRKSLCARVSIALLRVFLDFVDGLLRLLVEVFLHALGVFERLHLRAHRALLGPLGRLGALGSRIDLGSFGLGACREPCQREDRGRRDARDAHTRAALTR